MPDRFDAMRAFVTVCDARGFAAAARRMNLSASVVTRLVAGLEDRLGVLLLQRTTRSLKLTDAGARYVDHARRILADVEDAELSAQNERAEPRGRLVVSAPLLFGRMRVSPLVSRMLRAYPDLSIELQLSDRLVNLVEDGVDVAIRIGHLQDSALIARRLGQTRRLLVASPGYLAEAGGCPRRPADLVHHRLIAFQSMTAPREWSFRDRHGILSTVKVAPHFVTNSGDVAIDHAIGGGGITAALCYQVDAAIRSGVLIEVLPEFASPPMPIHAVFPTSRLLSGKVRAFLDMAQDEARGWGLVDAV